MKKKAFLRGLLGFPLGVSFGYMFTIIFSLFWAGGYYSPCVPSLIDAMGSEINAVIFQTILCGLLGTVYASSSIIYEFDHWSIARQTGIYFLISAVATLPVAYVAKWMQRSFWGFVSYFGIFIFIFVSVWLMEYAIWKIRIRRMNLKLR